MRLTEKEAVQEFNNNKREKDENLIATLEAVIGIRPVLDLYDLK